MITQSLLRERQAWTAEQLSQAGIHVTPQELGRIEVADFGLDDIDHFGIQLLTYINTARVCAKEIVMRPGQICPEHRHPDVQGLPGKEETFRCRAGSIQLYVPSDNSSASRPSSTLSEADLNVLTSRQEINLTPGDQYTVFPDTLHWFRAGAEGAIVSEFSTRSTDEADVFTDARISRIPTVSDE